MQSHDAVTWHDWRKALKQDRYTLEMVEPAPKILKQTLDALGNIQDAEVMLATVQQADWPYGHQTELIGQGRAARNRARVRVRQLSSQLTDYFKATAQRQGTK